MKLKTLLPDARATELLRAMLLDGAAARDAWSSWLARISDPMRALGEDAVMARPLLPLLYDSVRRNALPVDDATATYLRSAFLTESLRSRKYLEIVAELLSLYPDAVLIKGAAIGPLYYADPALRHAHDIEILVADPAALRASLASSRFRPSGADSIHDTGLPLRVHPTSHPTPRDATGHLAHTLLHAAESPSRHSGRWVCDAVMIRRTSPIDWPRFAETVIAANASIPVSAQLRYLRDAFGIDTPVLAQLEERAAHATRRERAQVRKRLAEGEVPLWRRLWRRVRGANTFAW